MTATLTRNFVYTDHASTTSSSALTDIWYNSADRRMVVKIKDSDILAGYDDVPLEVYQAFAAQNEGFWGSVGSYWNNFIKPVFPGFSTGDIEGFVFVDDEEAPVEYKGAEATEEEVAPVLWNIGFVDDEGFAADELYVYATSLNNAIEVASAVAAAAGWKNAELVAISKA